MKKQKLILVTGLLRSGTTWTGKTLAQAKSIKYINEPFNPDRDRKGCPLQYYYQYIDDNQPLPLQEAVVSYIDRMSRSPVFYLTDRIRLLRKYHKVNLKTILKLVREKKNISGRPLIKDPIAILSCEWIYTKFDAEVVIVLRHPAAFIGSLKKAGWSIPFPDLMAQEHVLKEQFNEFMPLIKQYSANLPDVIDQGILIWNIIYSRIKYYADKYGNDWYFVKHEDLSKDPLSGFTKLFAFLNIEFSEKVKSAIIRSSDGSTLNRLSRDSVQNLETWKRWLTPEEIIRIKDGTSKLYSFFYNEEDWSGQASLPLPARASNADR